MVLESSSTAAKNWSIIATRPDTISPYLGNTVRGVVKLTLSACTRAEEVRQRSCRVLQDDLKEAEALAEFLTS